eukprot:5028046-Amphidinium_carterae.1
MASGLDDNTVLACALMAQSRSGSKALSLPKERRVRETTCHDASVEHLVASAAAGGITFSHCAELPLRPRVQGLA